MKTNVLLRINSKRRKLDHHPLHLSFIHLMKSRRRYMAVQQDNRGEIQRQDFSKEMAAATSTRRTQPIYRRKRSKTISSSNSRSPKSRIISQIFRSPKRHDINRCSRTISIIMASESKGTPVTNFQEARPIVVLAVSQ